MIHRKNAMRLTSKFIPFVLFVIICCADALGAAVIDDFNDPTSWKGPIYQYGDSATGSALRCIKI